MKQYWVERFALHGEAFTDHLGKTKAENDKYRTQRLNFLKKHVKTKKKMVDYGCGIQPYRELAPHYIGVDIVPGHPETLVLKSDRITDEKIKGSHLFCSNVLQHCENFEAVVESWTKIEGLKAITIYEWTNGETTQPHCFSRTPEEYKSVIEKYFSFPHTADHSHKVHGEEFSLIMYG